MARKSIYVGSAPNSGDGTVARTAWGYVEANFIELYAMSAGVNHWRGAYDLSVNEYPSSGGTGDGGVPGAGDEWYVSVSGQVEVTGLPGTVTLNVNALLKYKGGDPTLAASWIVKQ